MRVFVCTDHDLHYPVGCASVVVAHDEAEARQLLDTALVKRGLQPSTAEPYTLKPLDTNRPAAVILRDGEY